MRNIKNWLAIYLALLLVTLCAFLPRLITMTVSNGSSLEEPEFFYADMQTDQLQIDEKVTLSTLEKLALFSHATAVEISADQAEMTEEEVLQMTYDRLDTYADAGLIDAGLIQENYRYFAIDSISPVILYSNDSLNKYNIAWQVSLSSPDQGVSFELFLDDETGLLLYIFYTSETEVYDSAELSTMVNYVADVYFSPLSLSHDIVSCDPDMTETEIAENAGPADQFSGTYCFNEADSGDFIIEVIVWYSGFSVTPLLQ